MRPFRERLARPGVILADGAIGTLLLQRGLKAGECPERMNLERTEVLEEIAGSYLDAGAEIIQTNTFGGSPLKLAAYGLDGRAEEMNARAVAAVRRAVGDRAYVCGSCGPSGRILEPYGDASADLVSGLVPQADEGPHRRGGRPDLRRDDDRPPRGRARRPGGAGPSRRPFPSAPP